MRKITCFILVLALLLYACALNASAEQPAGKPEQDVTILFTSDVHCGIDQNFTYAGLQAVKDTITGEG